MLATTPSFNGRHEVQAALEKTLPLSDSQLLRKLEQLWQSRDDKDLEVRLAMGRLLNKQLGPPTERATYGAEVISRAAKRLGFTKGDISRLRWYAFRYKKIAKRGAKNWTQVKKLLPKRSSKTGKGKASSEKRVAGFSRKTTSSLKSAIDNLRRIGKCPSGEVRDSLLKMVQRLTKAAERCLRVRVTIKKG
jgi:hypothetical protein